MATEREARELIAQIRVNVGSISEAKARAAQLIAKAKADRISLKRVAQETGLSEGWVKKVATSGKWPERMKRA